MDLFTHISAGLAVGSLVACASNQPQQQLKCIMLGAVGGALPDIDTISLWSGFDATFGTVFQLNHTGKFIYGSKLWYAHHAFFHSLAAALLWTCLPLIYIGLSKLTTNRKSNVHKLSYLSFILGYTLHLFCDMPTPASVWGGVNLLWPSSGYIGGTGSIWWWNNYDIFLLFNLCFIALGLILIAAKFMSFKPLKCASAISVIIGLLIIYQINTRTNNYQYEGNTTNFKKMEGQSKEEQRTILGSKIYGWMEQFDELIPLNF